MLVIILILSTIFLVVAHYNMEKQKRVATFKTAKLDFWTCLYKMSLLNFGLFALIAFVMFLQIGSEYKLDNEISYYQKEIGRTEIELRDSVNKSISKDSIKCDTTEVTCYLVTANTNPTLKSNKDVQSKVSTYNEYTEKLEKLNGTKELNSTLKFILYFGS